MDNMNHMNDHMGNHMRKSPLEHNHGSVTHTSCDHSHAHQCLDVSGPAIMTGESHVHNSENWVVYEHGHAHYYQATSGPSIATANGWHVHYWDFFTTVKDGHRHHIHGLDMPALGI